MSFSQKDYIFSHTMTRVSQPHQPAVFKIELRDLIPFGDCSALFVIDTMSITAYKQCTLEKIPVKFTVLNDNNKRVLTNDPCKLSSRWPVDINCGSCMKIAGTDTIPFSRTLSVYDEDNRQTLVNVLAFMMSNSLWTSDRAKGAFDILNDSTRGQFEFTCNVCLEIGVARITKGPGGHPLFTFPRCTDGYVCIPSPQPCADKDYEALRCLLALLRSASLDNLDILNRITGEMTADRACQEFDCTSFSTVHMYRGYIEIPYLEMKIITSLYQTMSEYADNFAIIDENSHHIKVLIESPSENIGEIVGCVSFTIIYGSTIFEMYGNLVHGLQHAEGHEDLTNMAQMSTDVLIRRTPLNFMMNNTMSLRDWCTFYYG